MPTIRLEDPEYNYIMAVLYKRPFEEVHALIAKIMHERQQQAPNTPPVRSLRTSDD